MTVSNDLTWIGVVLRAAKSVEGIPVHPEVVETAKYREIPSPVLPAYEALPESRHDWLSAGPPKHDVG
jgi:hypothetical protein